MGTIMDCSRVFSRNYAHAANILMQLSKRQYDHIEYNCITLSNNIYNEGKPYYQSISFGKNIVKSKG